VRNGGFLGSRELRGGEDKMGRTRGIKKGVESWSEGNRKGGKRGGQHWSVDQERHERELSRQLGRTGVRKAVWGAGGGEIVKKKHFRVVEEDNHTGAVTSTGEGKIGFRHE